jgi:hypothetical protein
VDEVKARRPVTLKFWLHGRAPFTIDASGSRIALEFGKASLTGFLRAPGGLNIVQTDKYPIPPEMGRTRPEWHLSAETKQKQADARFITVLGVGKAGQAIALDHVEDVSSGQSFVVRFQRAGKPVTVSIDLSGPSVAVK